MPQSKKVTHWQRNAENAELKSCFQQFFRFHDVLLVFRDVIRVWLHLYDVLKLLFSRLEFVGSEICFGQMQADI